MDVLATAELAQLVQRPSLEGRPMPPASAHDAETSTAAAFIPDRPTWTTLKEAAAICRACELWKRGTQTVFGEGPRHAPLFFIGEQPGDEEDLAGRPFVGPAGRLLERALAEAGIARDEVYITNVVKHFKWEPRGKRRLHSKPNAYEVRACRPWLLAEIELMKPRLLVCLGATASHAVIGRDFRVSQRRGEVLPSRLGPMATATVHPSSILRAPDDAARRAEMQRFIEDLKGLARFRAT